MGSVGKAGEGGLMEFTRVLLYSYCSNKSIRFRYFVASVLHQNWHTTNILPNIHMRVSYPIFINTWSRQLEFKHFV